MSYRKSGMKFTLNAAFFREIKEDHQQLKTVLERLRNLISRRLAVENHRREFADLLAELRDQLAFHFTLEEAYGYFEDAVERAPRFHEQAGRLRNQHSQLYIMCQEIAESAATRLANGGELDTLVDQAIAFDRALQAHESAEVSLIMDAINLDVGVGD